MIDLFVGPTVRCDGVVRANEPVSSGLIQLDLELDQPLSFQPGQFAMLNLAGSGSLVFSRPFSIFEAADCRMSFLYRTVGRGTRAMGALTPGAPMTFLGPLGRPFPQPEKDLPVVLIAGGVGLPPLSAWLARRFDHPDLEIHAFFGARDGADVPWDLLGDRWSVSVDSLRDVPVGRRAWEGLVTDLAAAREDLQDGRPRMVLACGPTPLLKAAARLAEARGWTCWLSLEEHMGCGYGVCKGCVVSVRDPARGPEARRNATCCKEGPVFNAADLAWEHNDPPDHPRADGI
jgi:dihydroorotate dehydrogenase electron transfer subunit